MKKYIFLLAGLVIAGGIFMGCNSTNVSNLNKYDDADIILQGNRTTGYTWGWSADDPELFTVEHFSLYRGDKGLVGAGENNYFYLKGQKAGTTLLTFYYSRSWEKGIDPAQTIRYQVTVDEDLKVSIEKLSDTETLQDSAE